MANGNRPVRVRWQQRQQRLFPVRHSHPRFDVMPARRSKVAQERGYTLCNWIPLEPAPMIRPASICRICGAKVVLKSDALALPEASVNVP